MSSKRTQRRINDEVETNISMARDKSQMSAAIRGTETALKLSGLLIDRPQDQPVQITRVVVHLNHGDGDVDTETRQINQPPEHVIKGESRTLPDDEAGC